MVEIGTEISVELENEPGTLGKVASALGQADLNILGFSLEAQGRTGTARFVTDDPETASSELESIGLTTQRRDLLLAPAPHEPGQLGTLSTTLGNSGVNIEGGFPVIDPTEQNPKIAFAVDDVESARKVIEG